MMPSTACSTLKAVSRWRSARSVRQNIASVVPVERSAFIAVSIALR